jgi:Tfp pilus assembly protein PilN
MKGFNLSTYSYTNKKSAFIAYLITALVVFIFTVYNVSSYLESTRNKEGLLDKVNTLAKGISSLEGSLTLKKRSFSRAGIVKDAEKLIKEIDNINAVIKQKNFSWSELFYSIEKAKPKGISIEAIKPNYTARKVNIKGFAKRLKDITKFVDNLKDTAYLKNGFLVNEQESLNEKKRRILSFEIVADGRFNGD